MHAYTHTEENFSICEYWNMKIAFAIFQYLLTFWSDCPVMLQLKPVEGPGGDSKVKPRSQRNESRLCGIDFRNWK